MPADTTPFSLGTIRSESGSRPALLVNDRFYILDDATLDSSDHNAGSRTTALGLLQNWSSSFKSLSTLANKISEGSDTAFHSIPYSSAEILTPLIFPPKLLCVGANYSGHLKEMNLPVEKMEPMPFFTRPPTTSLVGPGRTVRKPRSTKQLDWEVELVLVLGKPLRHATSKEQAADAIAGYSIGLDLSCRDLQASSLGMDIVRGKAQDTLAPVGPTIMPKEFMTRGVNDLSLKLWVNDGLKMDGRTNEMIYTPEEQLMEISKYMSLEVGDLVFTGAPAGSAKAHGGKYLEVGDRIKAQIEGVGVLEVEIVDDD